MASSAGQSTTVPPKSIKIVTDLILTMNLCNKRCNVPNANKISFSSKNKDKLTAELTD